MSRKSIAKLLGVSAAAVTHWVVGRAAPDPTRRRQLKDLLGIPEADWISQEERDRVKRLAAQYKREEKALSGTGD